MSDCKGCNDGCNDCKKSCNRVVIDKRGLIGPQGPPGIPGERGYPGANGTNGQDGASYVNKVNSYTENEEDIEVKDMASPDVYGFPGTTYNLLTYTNNTGATKPFIVHVSYDKFPEFTNENKGFNWVDGAIITNNGGGDVVVKENTDKMNLTVNIFDGVNSIDVVDIGVSTEKVQTTPGGNNVEARFLDVDVPMNVSFFAKVFLDDGESVSLKFKTKDNATDSRLVRAQMFVNELDQ